MTVAFVFFVTKASDKKHLAVALRQDGLLLAATTFDVRDEAGALSELRRRVLAGIHWATPLEWIDNPATHIGVQAALDLAHCHREAA